MYMEEKQIVVDLSQDRYDSSKTGTEIGRKNEHPAKRTDQPR